MGARRGLIVEGWPPPRGPRDEATGAWRYTLASRPDANWSSPLERVVARRYAFLVGRLIDFRYYAEMSVREVGAASGVSIATVTGIENGSSWARLDTMQTLAGVVGQAFAVRGDSDVCAALDALIVASRKTSRGAVTYASVAEEAGLQPNTVARLRRTTSPSMATVLALSYTLDASVSLIAPQSAGGRPEGEEGHQRRP